MGSALFSFFAFVSWARESLFQKPAMLGDSTAHALAPKAKAGGLQFAAHDRDHLVLDQSGACPDFLKGGAIFPSESNDTGDL